MQPYEYHNIIECHKYRLLVTQKTFASGRNCFQLIEIHLEIVDIRTIFIVQCGHPKAIAEAVIMTIPGVSGDNYSDKDYHTIISDIVRAKNDLTNTNHINNYHNHIDIDKDNQ